MSTLTIERRRWPRGRFRPLRDALYNMLRFLARHVRGFYGAVAAFLSVGLIVGVLAVAVFTLGARIVMAGATQSFDERVLEWIAGLRRPWLDAAMVEVTTLGDGFVVMTMVVISSLFLWLTRHHYSVYLLLIGVFGGHLLNSLLKQLYERPRPSIVQWATDVHSASFPSGHAMTALIAYGSIAYLVGRLEPTPRLRRATWIVGILLIASVGASRMYLGVHYPSDVLGGFLAGLAWTIFVAAGITAIRFFATRQPDVEREEKGLHLEEERAMGIRK
ncbi:MAG: phosphatase PAP2 family protein [Gemmatimonadetes bacterium]|nr:phosphatase PAP2 family protein [Gemmatimonadota bacterium]